QFVRRQPALEALPVNLGFAAGDTHPLRPVVGHPSAAVIAEEFVEVPREGFPGLALERAGPLASGDRLAARPPREPGAGGGWGRGRLLGRGFQRLAPPGPEPLPALHWGRGSSRGQGDSRSQARRGSGSPPGPRRPSRNTRAGCSSVAPASGKREVAKGVMPG